MIIINSPAQALKFFSIPGNIELYKKEQGGTFDFAFSQMKSNGWIPENIEQIAAKNAADAANTAAAAPAPPANGHATPEQVAEAGGYDPFPELIAAEEEQIAAKARPRGRLLMCFGAEDGLANSRGWSRLRQ